MKPRDVRQIARHRLHKRQARSNSVKPQPLPQTVEELLARVAVLENSLSSLGHGIIITESSGTILFCNDRLLALFQLSKEEVALHAPDWKECIAQRMKTPERMVEFFKQVHSSTSRQTLDAFEMRDGRWVEVRTNQIEYPVEPNRTARVWSFYDETEQHRREQELRRSSMFDSLTGVHNRLYFEMSLKRCKEQAAFPIGLIMIDVDGLKNVNDSLGHKAGDELLCSAASILRQACRSSDIVARLGGDEFVVLIEKADEQAASQLANRIYGLTNVHNIRHPDSPVFLSIGVASATSIAEVDNLSARADEKMYQDKRQRRAARGFPAKNALWW